MSATHDIRAIAPFDRATAMRLAETEYERFFDLVSALTADDWTRATDCDRWNVRDIVAHVTGAAEGLTSLREFLHQGYRAWRRDESFVDALGQVQIGDRAACTNAELVDRLQATGPRAVRTRSRLPAILRRMPLRFEMPGGAEERTSVGVLHDVILTRDVWMHRVDIACAVERPLVLSADHDGVLVADVVADWSRRHGQPFRLMLEGEAGGEFQNGDDGALIGPLDAVEFCRICSGRASGTGLLATGVPF